MALQGSGQLIRMSQINTELGRSSTAAISLDTAENGGYGTINTCSPVYPLAANPASMSEWYGYNHLASCGPAAASVYAFSDGGDSLSQNMLYANSLNWETRVYANKPSINDVFSISFWIKRALPDSNQGYILGWNAPSGDHILMSWSAFEDTNNPGTFWNYMYLSADCPPPGGYLGSAVNFSDNNNFPITGVNPMTSWKPDNPGFVGSHGYVLITVVVNNGLFGTNNYVKWYWNDTMLDVKWQAQIPGRSSTYADTPTTANWNGTDFFIGGYVPSELSAGCQLDGVAIWPGYALTDGNVATIYNSGSMAALSAYQGINSNFVFYNFESVSPNLGLDSNTTFAMNLDEFNNPTRVADPAV